MRFELGPIEALESAAHSHGAPLLLPIDSIEEDPAQPRIDFDSQELLELAETIKSRGVRQPISVRPHAVTPDRWILNFGSRRLRASRLAGRSEIPAFVDQTTDAYDQVIENEQRAPLNAMELALFLKRELSTGKTQAGIARALGKSKAYVTYLCALIDAPEWLAALYAEGRCRGIKELYDLRRLWQAHPTVVGEWSAREGHVSRRDVDGLVAQLRSSEGAGVVGASAASRPPPGEIEHSPEPDVLASSANKRQRQARTSGPNLARLEVRADVDGQVVRVLTDRVPADGEEVFVAGLSGTSCKAVPVASLTGLRLLRRP